MENMKIRGGGGGGELSPQPTKEYLNQDDKDQIQKWLQPSSTFCVYPWIEMILNLSSNYTLCCKNISDPFKDKKTGKAWTLTEHSLEDWWNSSALREVRRKNACR